MIVLAIDPGNIQSAYLIFDSDKQVIIEANIVENQYLLPSYVDCMVIEMVASYGMPVGETVFETCVWTGRFIERFSQQNIECNKIYRKDVKMHLCHSMKANDASIRQALVDRFGPPGTKKAKGRLYGIKKDLWSALAIAVTWSDLH